jgi:hypothetical protein
MDITNRELWGFVHGMGMGAIFLLAFAGGLAGIYSLRPEWVTTAGIKERLVRLKTGMWVMAIAAWGAVVTGTFVVYPWYRDAAPTSPKSLLIANPGTIEWHNFGMEWKEHVGWIAPIAATVVAFIIVRYGPQLANEPKIRRALMIFFVLAFVAAAAAGMFGAFITKAAPVH